MASSSSIQAQVHKRSNTPVICQHHQGQRAVLVCLQPQCEQAFACIKCVGTNHRGHEMEDITDCAENKTHILQKRVKTGKQTVLVSLQQQIKSTEDGISANTSKSRDIQEKIFERCKTLQKKFDIIATKYADLCKTTEIDNHTKLTIHKENLESMLEMYAAKLQEFEEIVEEGSECDIILAEREGFPTSPDLIDIPCIHDHQFRFKATSDKELEGLFGDLSCTKDTPQDGVNLATDSSSVSPNIKYISQFLLYSDNRCNCAYLHPVSSDLYLWFCSSQFVSVVTESGKIKHSLNLPLDITHDGNITDVCVSPADGTLWFATFNGCIKQVKGNATLLLSLPLSTYCYTLCVTQTQSVVVGMYGKVQMLTTSGTVNMTVELTDIGLSTTTDCIVHCQETGRFALSDLDDASLSVVDENLKLLYTIHEETIKKSDGSTSTTGYKPERKFTPHRMCFDVDGDLLVIDTNNYSVIMFNRSGQYICTIIQETADDNRPCAITTSPDGALWVAHEGGAFKHIKYNKTMMQ